MTTKKLPDYLQFWRSRAFSLSPHQRRENAKYIDKSLSFVNGIAFNYLDFKNMLHAGKWPLDDCTIMSILVLYHTLSVFAINLYPGLLDDKILLWPSSRFLNDKMREISWCDSFIGSLNDVLSLDTIYFMSDLTWPPLSPTHERCTVHIRYVALSRLTQLLMKLNTFLKATIVLSLDLTKNAIVLSLDLTKK